ncbi:hypothetical protein GOBAR_DD08948 [Gossypium barbadense]|nr:hypothetical protein GOBAR_DD08948 [Gossypium barbadense]
MREEDSNWFSRWEEELPSPDELMPLSQSLITPDLAMAFDIRNPNHHHAQQQQSSVQPAPPPPSAAVQPSSQPTLAEFAADSGDLGSGAAGDEPARTLKRPRLVWTPQLHKRFVDAVAHLGIKNAVPKTIMQLMSVDGLTRENVASHLQKYRLYLKRMQGLSGGSGGGANGGSGGAGLGASADPATDHLFASSPVPPHFLHPDFTAAIKLPVAFCVLSQLLVMDINRDVSLSDEYVLRLIMLAITSVCWYQVNLVFFVAMVTGNYLSLLKI